MIKNPQWKKESKMDTSNLYNVISWAWRDYCLITDTHVIRLSNGDAAEILHRERDLICIYWRRWNSLEYLVYNKDCNNYFVLDKNRLLKTANRNPDLFIVVCNTKKFIGYVIPKNGCSSIMSAAGLYDYQLNFSEPWAHGEAYQVIIKIRDYNSSKYSGYTHFAVYNDPVERFVNLCNYTYARKHFLVAPYALPELPKGEFISSLITMASVIAPRRGLEPHFQTQWHYLREMPYLDYLVHIKDFSRFQVDQLGFENVVRANKSSSDRKITLQDFTEDQVNSVRRIYAEDYLIPQLYGNKMYS